MGVQNSLHLAKASLSSFGGHDIETLLDHRVTLDELQQIEDYEAWSLAHYEFMVSVTVNCQKSRDCFYRRIAELYDLRGKHAKAAEYRAKLND